MRVGIDGRALQGFIEGHRAGVGRYVYELCRELDSMLPHATFFVYSPEKIEMPVVSDRWVLQVDRSKWARILRPVLWTKYRCGDLCKSDNLDVFWAAGTFLPKLNSNVRTVITVYDLNFKVAPKTMRWMHRWAYELFFETDIKKAHCVTAISKGTSERLLRYYNCECNAVVYPAVGEQFKREPESVTDALLQRYGVARPYLLALGTHEPRKNLEALLEAFSALKQRGELTNHNLVLVGGLGWKSNKLALTISAAEAVTHLGFIADNHLPAIYSGAEVFIFPSIYEGFGIPAAEARACGTKVIASDIPELREAAREDGIYVRPTSEGIQTGILRALAQPPEQQTINRFRLNSWRNSAQALAACFIDGGA